MENASKALLMAAGVLMGVMVLTLAVYLYASFGGSADLIQKNIEQGQLSQFNSNFNGYTAKDCTIYDVISAINFANDYNTKNEYTTDEYMVKVYLDGTLYNNQVNETIIKHVLNKDERYTSVSGDKEFSLLRFECKLSYSELTGKVDKVMFTKK